MYIYILYLSLLQCHSGCRHAGTLPSCQLGSTGKSAKSPSHWQREGASTSDMTKPLCFGRIYQSQKKLAGQIIYSKLSIKYLYIHCVCGIANFSFHVRTVFFLHVCKSPQRSLTNFPHRKFHHFKSVQHQDTTKLQSQALILWTQPGLSTPMNFKPLGCLVGGY